jgi:hypothetical protein
MSSKIGRHPQIQEIRNVTMRNILVVLLLIVLTVALPAQNAAVDYTAQAIAQAQANVAQQKHQSEFPIVFTVEWSSIVNMGDAYCLMKLSDGRRSYNVKNEGGLHCHIWPTGTTLSGKFDHGYEVVVLSAVDEKGKLHKYVCSVLQISE